MTESDFLLLKSFSETFAPSGFEDELRENIIPIITPFVSEIYTDPMGNLHAKKGNGGEILFDAHMDEVGMMIKEIGEDGNLRFDELSGIMPDYLASKRLRIGKDRIPGTISARPIHFSRKRKEYNPPAFSDLMIEIGARNRAEALESVKIGDCAVFDTEFGYLSPDKSSIKGKALDDRIGCYLLCKMIFDPEIENVSFVFTVQEETGCRGAAAAARQGSFAYSVSVEGTTASDLPGTAFPASVCCLGKGPVLSFADALTIYDHDLCREILQDLEEHEIPSQTKSMLCGGNNAASLQKYGSENTVLVLSCPCRFIHSPVSSARISDIDYMEAALKRIYTILS